VSQAGWYNLLLLSLILLVLSQYLCESYTVECQRVACRLCREEDSVFGDLLAERYTRRAGQNTRVAYRRSADRQFQHR